MVELEKNEYYIERNTCNNKIISEDFKKERWLRNIDSISKLQREEGRTKLNRFVMVVK